MEYAPIVLFVYNRPRHTQKTIEALCVNKLAVHSTLIIYSDASKDIASNIKVDAVREYIKSVRGFKKIIIYERKENWGLAKSIIEGVSDNVKKYGKIIVLEDDLVPSPFFLDYMNDALTLYEYDEKVASVNGYLYPISGEVPDSFFIKGADCWGWGTWERAWKLFEADGQKLFDRLVSRQLQKEVNFNNSFNYTKMLKKQIAGKNDSWAIRWYISTFLENKLTLYPGISHIDNIGIDNSGANIGVNAKFKVKLADSYKKLDKIPLSENQKIREKFEVYFLSLKYDIFNKVFNRLRRKLSSGSIN